MKVLWCKHVHVCLKFYSQEFRVWRTSILRVCLFGIFSPIVPASRNVLDGVLGKSGDGGPVLVAGDGWGAVPDVPGWVVGTWSFPVVQP